MLIMRSPGRIRTDTCTGLSRIPLPGWDTGPENENARERHSHSV